METYKNIEKKKVKYFKVVLYTQQTGTLLVRARTRNEVLNKYLDNKLNEEDIEITNDGQWELENGIDSIEEVME
jgi:hypothetical protein